MFVEVGLAELGLAGCVWMVRWVGGGRGSGL